MVSIATDRAPSSRRSFRSVLRRGKSSNRRTSSEDNHDIAAHAMTSERSNRSSKSMRSFSFGRLSSKKSIRKVRSAKEVAEDEKKKLDVAKNAEEAVMAAEKSADTTKSFPQVAVDTEKVFMSDEAREDEECSANTGGTESRDQNRAKSTVPVVDQNQDKEVATSNGSTRRLPEGDSARDGSGNDKDMESKLASDDVAEMDNVSKTCEQNTPAKESNAMKVKADIDNFDFKEPSKTTFISKDTSSLVMSDELFRRETSPVSMTFDSKSKMTIAPVEKQSPTSYITGSSKKALSSPGKGNTAGKADPEKSESLEESTVTKAQMDDSIEATTESLSKITEAEGAPEQSSQHTKEVEHAAGDISTATITESKTHSIEESTSDIGVSTATSEDEGDDLSDADDAISVIKEEQSKLQQQLRSAQNHLADFAKLVSPSKMRDKSTKERLVKRADRPPASARSTPSFAINDSLSEKQNESIEVEAVAEEKGNTQLVKKRKEEKEPNDGGGEEVMTPIASNASFGERSSCFNDAIVKTGTDEDEVEECDNTASKATDAKADASDSEKKAGAKSKAESEGEDVVAASFKCCGCGVLAPVQECNDGLDDEASRVTESTGQTGSWSVSNWVFG